MPLAGKLALYTWACMYITMALCAGKALPVSGAQRLFIITLYHEYSEYANINKNI